MLSTRDESCSPSHLNYLLTILLGLYLLWHLLILLLVTS
jgi:hypothetical protein